MNALEAKLYAHYKAINDRIEATVGEAIQSNTLTYGPPDLPSDIGAAVSQIKACFRAFEINAVDMFMDSLVAELNDMPDDEVLDGEDPEVVKARGLAILKAAGVVVIDDKAVGSTV